MSKQSEAKEHQGYTTVPKNCGNCMYRAFEEVKDEYLYIHEKNNRCAIGGFAIKKTASCSMWEQK